MSKKIIMVCMAVAALAAFVLPASALALNDPTLTDPDHVKVGSKIIGTNIGNADFMNTTGEGNPQVSCSKATLTGEVLKNSLGTVEGKITKAEFSGTSAEKHVDNGLNKCTATFGNAGVTVGLPLTVKSTPAMATDEFQVSGTGAGGTVTFQILSTVAGTCSYLTTGVVKGDYTTGATTKLTVRNTQAGSGATRYAGGFLCPSSGQLRMTFYLMTDVAGNPEIGIS